jgi:hypothetical protein
MLKAVHEPTPGYLLRVDGTARIAYQCLVFEMEPMSECVVVRLAAATSQHRMSSATAPRRSPCFESGR